MTHIWRGMRRFLSPAAVLTAAWLSVSCSDKPSHPDAGLRVYDDKGGVVAATRFRSVTEVQDGRVALTTTTSDFRSVSGGHDIRIRWTQDYGYPSDRYDFQITVDGANHRRSVKYSGKPIVLLEKPHRVVLENVKP